MRTLAANWEAEVAGARNDNRRLHSSLQEAQAQQRQDEERARALEQKAKEADDLRAALDAKVAALTAAEGQLLQERTAHQGAEGRLQQEQAVKPRIFIENPNPCTIAIVPGSVAIAYRTSHR
jgi:hypothetical protein